MIRPEARCQHWHRHHLVLSLGLCIFGLLSANAQDDGDQPQQAPSEIVAPPDGQPGGPGGPRGAGPGGGGLT
ncbi:MAG: hypothetical protein AAF236_10825, partial [Verrucomicrobiota bacterium]